MPSKTPTPSTKPMSDVVGAGALAAHTVHTSSKQKKQVSHSADSVHIPPPGTGVLVGVGVTVGVSVGVGPSTHSQKSLTAVVQNWLEAQAHVVPLAPAPAQPAASKQISSHSDSQAFVSATQP